MLKEKEGAHKKEENREPSKVTPEESTEEVIADNTKSENCALTSVEESCESLRMGSPLQNNAEQKSKHSDEKKSTVVSYSICNL